MIGLIIGLNLSSASAADVPYSDMGDYPIMPMIYEQPSGSSYKYFNNSYSYGTSDFYSANTNSLYYIGDLLSDIYSKIPSSSGSSGSSSGPSGSSYSYFNKSSSTSTSDFYNAVSRSGAYIGQFLYDYITAGSSTRGYGLPQGTGYLYSVGSTSGSSDFWKAVTNSLEDEQSNTYDMRGNVSSILNYVKMLNDKGSVSGSCNWTTGNISDTLLYLKSMNTGISTIENSNDDIVSNTGNIYVNNQSILRQLTPMIGNNYINSSGQVVSLPNNSTLGLVLQQGLVGISHNLVNGNDYWVYQNWSDRQTTSHSGIGILSLLTDMNQSLQTPLAKLQYFLASDDMIEQKSQYQDIEDNAMGGDTHSNLADSQAGIGSVGSMFQPSQGSGNAYDDFNSALSGTGDFSSPWDTPWAWFTQENQDSMSYNQGVMAMDDSDIPGFLPGDYIDFSDSAAVEKWGEDKW